MRGLTLRPPHAHAVAHLGKRIENRSRRPPRIVVGKLIAVHSAQGLRPAFDLIARVSVSRSSGQPVPADLPRGCIVAVARVADVVTADDPRAADAWFTGPVGWILTDVQALPAPLPCQGGQGLWRVPRRVVTALRRALTHNT